MTDKPLDSAQAAARLLAALTAPDPLDHDSAAALLPAYVAAERAGVDVDGLPEYADLARHLDQCEDCLTLYSELSADLETMLAAGEPLPAPAPRALATTIRNTESVVLRVFAGLRRRFEAIFAIPQTPQFAALSGGRRAVLLNEQLADVVGEPVVSISVGGSPGARDLLVAVSDEGAPDRWEVQVDLGGTRLQGRTDEQGIARFTGLALDAGDRLAIVVGEADPG